MKTCSKLKLIVVGTLALAANASAATIVSVDVANPIYNGGGVLNTNPTNLAWTTGNFVLDGDSISVTFGNGFNGGSFGNPTIGLFQNYIHSGSSISLSGLDITKLYSIVLYSADATGQGASWTLATGTYGGASMTRISTGSQTSTFVEGENYVRFDNITSSAGGAISFNLANDGSGAPIFNAFEIAVVPEPSAALLGGLGALALLRRRRA